MPRPSHSHLMTATEALGEARDAEQRAGNGELSQVLNEFVLALFKVATDTSIPDAGQSPTAPVGNPDAEARVLALVRAELRRTAENNDAPLVDDYLADVVRFLARQLPAGDPPREAADDGLGE
jgi:hypothetical protein